MTISEISLWVDNDEGLYTWFKHSRLSKTKFIRENRIELTEAINRVLNRPPKQTKYIY